MQAINPSEAGIAVARPNIINPFSDELKRMGFKTLGLSPAASDELKKGKLRRFLGDVYAYVLSQSVGFLVRRIEWHNMRVVNMARNTMALVLKAHPGFSELAVGPVNVYKDGDGYSVQYFPRPTAQRPEWVEKMIADFALDEPPRQSAELRYVNARTDPPVESEGGEL